MEIREREWPTLCRPQTYFGLEVKSAVISVSFNYDKMENYLYA